MVEQNLRILMEQERTKDWIRLVPWAVLTVNSQRRFSTGFSPHELFHGGRPAFFALNGAFCGWPGRGEGSCAPSFFREGREPETKFNRGLSTATTNQYYHTGTQQSLLQMNPSPKPPPVLKLSCSNPQNRNCTAFGNQAETPALCRTTCMVRQNPLS